MSLYQDHGKVQDSKKKLPRVGSKYVSRESTKRGKLFRDKRKPPSEISLDLFSLPADFANSAKCYSIKIYESRAANPLSRPAYFKSDGPMMEIEMWRPWRQCISPKCQMSHLYPNGPSTECPRSVTTVTYAYRVVGILRDDKQRRNRCYRKSNSKSFSLGKSRLELRTKSQSV